METYLISNDDSDLFHFKNMDLFYAFCNTYHLIFLKTKATLSEWAEFFSQLSPNLYNVWITEYIEPYYDNTLVIKNTFIRTTLLVRYLSVIPRHSKRVDGLFRKPLRQMKIYDWWREGLFLSLMAHWLLSRYAPRDVDYFIFKLDSIFYLLGESTESNDQKSAIVDASE